MVAVIAATLVGTTAVTADSALAYERNREINQVNDCGNGKLPLNVGCQNTATQIQGDEIINCNIIRFFNLVFTTDTWNHVNLRPFCNFLLYPMS
jgi:hypothetical protein